MGGYLDDGTVLPHYLTPGRAPAGGTRSVTENTALRVGEIVASFPPDDPNNLHRGLQWEYMVHVAHRNSAGMVSVEPYRCVVMDGFGGVGDHLRHTYRCADAKPQVGQWANGARVLILCVNGDKSSAYIVGGIRHETDLEPDPSETFLDFEFNGVHAAIDAQGALVVEVPGATTTDGNPDPDRSEDNHGSKVSFDPDGTIIVSDENGESIRISPKDKLVEVLSEEVNVHAKAGVTIYAEGDALVHADGEARVEGRTIRLGSAGAQENLVLGASLMRALGDLIQIFTGMPFIGQATGPTSPVLLHPATAARLSAWAAQYANAAGPLLARDKFTEM